MATKRQKGNSWEFIVKRSGILEKPLSLTFRTEEEGDEYCRKLEALLDRGIVPTEYQPKPRVVTLSHLIRQYLREAHVSMKDQEALRTVEKDVGDATCVGIDANWVDGWVAGMKQRYKYAPATIRAKVGALARCTDWGMRKKLIILPDHPFRTLPDGYSQYSPTDAAIVGEKRVDEERDRRLEPGEEEAIREVISCGVLPRKQRKFTIPHQDHIDVLFRLGLETAMRLREMYTLSASQVDMAKRTVFLDKTKNGDKRQVPLSSIAVKLLEPYAGKEGDLFPWLAEQKGNLKLTTNYLSKLYANIFEAAGCADLRFHDIRHEATSRFFEKTNLSGEEIMKVTGHHSHRMLMRYLKLRASDLAARLW